MRLIDLDSDYIQETIYRRGFKTRQDIKDCKYGDYDSKLNDAMICTRTNDGYWRRGNDFCSYGEKQREIY